MPRDPSSINLNIPKVDRLSIRQIIHRSLSDVEPIPSVVNTENVDASSVIGNAPAATTLRRVPSTDGVDCSDVREAGERAKGGEPAGEETVGAVGASGGSKRGVSIVVVVVVLELEGSDRGSEESDGGDEELHGGRDGRKRMGR